jgi:FkbM family methyltransferase
MCDEHRTAIDIGAAYGLYSWHLQRICQRCIAFEANPDSAATLRKALSKTEVFACALSERPGNAALRIPRRGNLQLTGFGTLEPQDGDSFNSYDEISVDIRTLDSFCFTDVGFIKIDVEGHELAVLRGAVQTIHCSKPVLLVELNNTNETKFDSHEAVIWLRERGYRRAHMRTSPQNFLFVPEKP